MPSHAAITEQFLALLPNTEVEKALKELKKKKLESAIVINDKGQVEGTFSLQGVMKNLLPVSVAMEDGIQLDITVRAAPGIAKRLRKVYPLKVSELMDHKVQAVAPETPIWEVINYLVSHNDSLWVIEPESGKCLGMITAQSAMDELKRLQESES